MYRRERRCHTFFCEIINTDQTISVNEAAQMKILNNECRKNRIQRNTEEKTYFTTYGTSGTMDSNKIEELQFYEFYVFSYRATILILLSSLVYYEHEILPLSPVILPEFEVLLEKPQVEKL